MKSERHPFDAPVICEVSKMSELRDYIHDACESLDASIFNGDVLYSDDERAELKEYVNRWHQALMPWLGDTEGTMTEKTIIECDALNCAAEYEHLGGDFLMVDITDKGWVYVPEAETHYCSKCKHDVVRELTDQGIEFIA